MVTTQELVFALQEIMNYQKENDTKCLTATAVTKTFTLQWYSLMDNNTTLVTVTFPSLKLKSCGKLGDSTSGKSQRVLAETTFMQEKMPA